MASLKDDFERANSQSARMKRRARKWHRLNQLYVALTNSATTTGDREHYRACSAYAFERHMKCRKGQVEA